MSRISTRVLCDQNFARVTQLPRSNAGAATVVG